MPLESDKTSQSSVVSLEDLGFQEDPSVNQSESKYFFHTIKCSRTEQNAVTKLYYLSIASTSLNISIVAMNYKKFIRF